MATSRTRSRRRRAERGKTSPQPSPKGRGSVIIRLLAVKRGRLAPRSVEDAAMGTLRGKRLAALEHDMLSMQKSIVQVKNIREQLADVPALTQRGTVL